MPFSSPVYLSWDDDAERMTVLLEVTYTDPRGRIWTARDGFVTDGASIPAALWPLMGSPFTGRYRLPAVLHDCAYSTVGLTRADADRMFYEAMREAGVGAVMAWLMYAAVRLFGWGPWRRAQGL